MDGPALKVLGLGRASGGDQVFRDLVLARIIEPVSKLDSLRVLENAGAPPGVVCHFEVAPAGLCEGNVPAEAVRCLRRAPGWARPPSLILYDVSTLYFETDAPGTGSARAGSPSSGG